jgi:hypothetical protein
LVHRRRHRGTRTLLLHWDGTGITERETLDGSAGTVSATSRNDAWLFISEQPDWSL